MRTATGVSRIRSGDVITRADVLQALLFGSIVEPVDAHGWEAVALYTGPVEWSITGYMTCTPEQMLRMSRRWRVVRVGRHVG